MNWKLALTALLASPAGTSLLANAQGMCPPKPKSVRDIKFSDIGGDAIHNFEFHGNARIVEPAPDGIPRALRIDQLFSYALLKEIDISPSKMPDATMAIGVYIESIRPAITNAPNPDQNESYGWVMSHDNGGYDRAIFLHDERFNGVGMSAGYIPEAEPLHIPLQEWVQVVAVWRQGGECALYIQNEKVDFTEAVIGKNNDGLPSIAIGAPQLRKYGKENDNDFWIKDVKIFDYALSDQEVEDLNCNFVETLEPTIDCGQGDAPVFSCTECVRGDGSASGCGGQCKWTPEVPNCVEKEENPDDTIESGVNCGDHDAADCSQCDASAGCAGDCKFDDASQTCVDLGYTTESTCEPINVALATNGGVASQSSVWGDGSVAERAIDGNTNGNWSGKSVMATLKDANPWWQVKFNRAVISDIFIHNRVDCCGSRMIGGIVEVFDGGRLVYSSITSASLETKTNKKLYHFEVPQVTGDTVRVRLPKKENLNVAEVEVISSCEPQCVPTNIALATNGGVASQSSVWGDGSVAERAIDGNTNGNWSGKSVMATLKDANPWWQVKFNRAVISDIFIHNRVDCCGSRMIGGIVEVFEGGRLVYSSITSASLETKTDKKLYHFEVPQVTGDTVRVRLPKKENLNVAEVEVISSCETSVPRPQCNVALATNGGVASQSSVWGDGSVAERAIDGNTNGNWSGKSVMATKKDANPWWQVKFNRTVVSDIFIHNRVDCCGSRMIGGIVEVFDGGRLVYSSITSASLETKTDKKLYHFEVPQVTGDTVRVRLPKKENLNVAEVQVMGAC